MKNLIVSAQIRSKLDTKHSVTVREVEQCFYNREGEYFEDVIEEHRTDPPSWWFIAPTNQGRELKIIFVAKDGNIYLKSAYDASAGALALYEALNRQTGENHE